MCKDLFTFRFLRLTPFTPFTPFITDTKILTPVRLHNKSSATDDVITVNDSDALPVQEAAELCTCHVATDRRTHSDFIKLC
jgi:hypothetical protein